MTCEEVHAKVKPFLKHSLSVTDTLALIRHMEKCSECSDDMEVAYMIDMMSGLERGEDLPSYDLKKLFRERIKAERMKCRVKILLMFSASAASLAALAFFIIYRL